MNASELKLLIFRKIDSLEPKKLQEVYNHLQNLFREDEDLSDWNNLTDTQKSGLLNAMNDIEAGQGIVHEEVIAKYKKKYPDA